MAVKQISVLLGNAPGTLARLTNILDKEDITAKALLAASAAESSTVRMVVNDPERKGRRRFWRALASIMRSPPFSPPRCRCIRVE